jgi:guanine deaminase
MDQNSPDYYVDDTDASLAKTERFIREHQYSERVKPILTPRFAPTCSRRLMEGLGELAKKYDLGVQTHLVESKAEAAWAKELFPEFGSDGQIYESCGLLQGKGPKIFAHVIFPSEVEERILKEYDGISVHCPDATSNITAGIMPASAMHEKGLKIALGSDVGGGHFLGIYRQVARAAQISKMKEFYEEDYRRIKLANAFYLATVTGGSIFDRVGKLEKGYRFNALVIDNMLDEEYVTSLQDALERFCYIGDERNIFERYIDGKKVDPEAVYQKLINL